jgi:hypothetical protein
MGQEWHWTNRSGHLQDPGTGWRVNITKDLTKSVSMNWIHLAQERD